MVTSLQKSLSYIRWNSFNRGKRQFEIKSKNEYADKHTEQISTNTTQGFKTPNERAVYHKNRRDEWTQENDVLLRAQKMFENWWNSS